MVCISLNLEALALPHICTACRGKWNLSWFMKMRWKQIRPKPYCKLFSFITSDVFDGCWLWCWSRPVGTLMSVCGLAVEVELPSDGDLKPSPFNYEGPPRDLLLLCQSLSCSVATCTICLSLWVTAEWQVPSENMAHNVNARQACGLRKDCSCPSLFPTSSVTAKADVMARSSPKNLLADISSFCHTAEKRWENDWRRWKVCRMPGWLTFDGWVWWRTQYNVPF